MIIKEFITASKRDPIIYFVDFVASILSIPLCNASNNASQENAPQLGNPRPRCMMKTRLGLFGGVFHGNLYPGILSPHTIQGIPKTDTYVRIPRMNAFSLVSNS